VTSSKSVSICAPAYNEEAGIAFVIQTWVFSLEQAIKVNLINEYEIVICDDGSTDNTVTVLKSLKLNSLVIIENEDNQGPGIAIKKAISASQMEYVITIDSDGQFVLKEALEWLSVAQKENAVLGYRQKADKFALKAGSSLSTWIFNKTLVRDIPDANCMLKLIPGEISRGLDLRAIGLNYSGEMTFLLLQSGLQIDWKIVSHKARVSGKSSAKFLEDGAKRLLFQLFLTFEYRLIKMKILTERSS